MFIYLFNHFLIVKYMEYKIDHLNHFLKDFIYLFLERGEGKEKERKRNINVWLPLKCPLVPPSGGGLAHNLGMCPN